MILGIVLRVVSVTIGLLEVNNHNVFYSDNNREVTVITQDLSKLFG